MAGERSKRLVLSPEGWLPTLLIVGYAIAVLAIDALATSNAKFGFDWGVFRCRLRNGFDVYKFLAWFAIPFVCSLPRMDWGYFGFKRWKRRDIYLLLVMAALGLVAVLAIPLFPGLRSLYRGLGEYPWARKWQYSKQTLLWTFSWLVGWEFLHRYFLLTHVHKRWPRFGWLIIPLFEGVYHLQKPLIEAFGMALFSLLLTQWTVRRRNALLPGLAHLIVELELLAFRLVY